MDYELYKFEKALIEDPNNQFDEDDDELDEIMNKLIGGLDDDAATVQDNLSLMKEILDRRHNRLNKF